MQWHDILILSLFGCCTIALMVLKLLKVGNRRRGVIKMIASVLFVTAGVFGCVNHRGGYSIIALAGLFCAMLGDLFLVFMDNRRYFIAGVLAFSCASLLLSIYSVLYFGWVYWSVIVAVILVISSVLCQKFKVYSYGKYIVYLNIYMIMVSLCGSLGLSLFCQGTANLSMFLFGLGCFMYLSSDVCLGMYMFKFRNRAVDAINTALYFPGMMLIALSLIL